MRMASMGEEEVGGNQKKKALSRLEVRRFAKARAPEIQSLQMALKAMIATRRSSRHPNAAQDSTPSIPRSLRRRTTSYNRRKPFCWNPRTKKNNLKSSSSSSSASLPINKHQKNQKRRAEDGCLLLQINEVVEKGDKEGKAGESVKGSDETLVRKRKIVKKVLSRRVRRRIELKGGSDGLGGICSDGTQRLATHVWHAKRFKMTKLWGYWLAEGYPGRGRGSRALLKMANKGALVHDASYHNAIEIKGRRDALLETLKVVLEPAPGLLQGAVGSDSPYTCFESGVIHEAGKVPFKAIAPVLLVWRPSFVQLQSSLPGATSFSNYETSEQQLPLTEPPDEECQLWILVHAAAFDSTLQELEAACDQQFTKHGRVMVSCVSRKGELARLDVMGAKASQVLQKVLVSVTSPTYVRSSMEALKVDSSESFQAGDKAKFQGLLLEQVNRQANKAIFLLEVFDPRDLPNRRRILSSYGDKEREILSPSGGPWAGDFLSSGRTARLEINPMILQGMPDCPAFWKSITGRDAPSINPPVTVKCLCARRRRENLSYYHIKHEAHTPKNLEQNPNLGGSTCPVFLLKHSCSQSSISRWSLILPMSWVRAFWLPFLSAGARAIGQREYRWLLTDAGIPSFPYDFPDVPSFAVYNESDSKDPRQPKQQLLQNSPVCYSRPPPWICMVQGIDDMTMASDREIKVADMAHENSGFERMAPLYMKFPGFVARTKSSLDMFLKENNLRHVLIFPGRRRDSRFFVEGELRRHKLVWQACSEETKKPLESTHLVNLFKERKTACFLRVLIRAPRKGVLKERALIYSPTVQDFNAWFCRSNRWQGLKKSLTCSAAHKSEKGNSDFKCTNVNHERMRSTALDGWSAAADKESKLFDTSLSRQPIGFVTSPAPRGSNTDAACALVELSALCKIRSMQLTDGRWGNSREIFCLFNNENSDILRPSLASIVLEAMDDVP